MSLLAYANLHPTEHQTANKGASNIFVSCSLRARCLLADRSLCLLPGCCLFAVCSLPVHCMFAAWSLPCFSASVESHMVQSPGRSYTHLPIPEESYRVPNTGPIPELVDFRRLSIKEKEELQESIEDRWSPRS